jgi:hypothetical protein
MDVLVLGDFYTSDRGSGSPERVADRTEPVPARDAAADVAYSARATPG